jgi:hypothetical protein
VHALLLLLMRWLSTATSADLEKMLVDWIAFRSSI